MQQAPPIAHSNLQASNRLLVEDDVVPKNIVVLHIFIVHFQREPYQSLMTSSPFGWTHEHDVVIWLMYSILDINFS